MTTIEEIREERERRERVAKDRAATLPPGDYYASDEFLMRRGDLEFSMECETHWDACLVMLATGKA